MAAAALAIAIAAVAALWLTRSTESESAADPLPVPVPLTSYRGEEDAPSFSPDGGRVAFHWRDERGSDIYVKLIGGESRQRLTTHPSRDRSPAWSPDGTQIAFVRGNLGEPAKLVVMPSIGGRERTFDELSLDPLLGPEVFGPLLAWHPSGEWLVSESRSGLLAVSLETGQVRRLTASPPGALGDSCPAFSPDGRSLAFCRVANWTSVNLFRVELDADLEPLAEPVQITREENASLTSPVWLPGGREILFSTSARKGTLAILRLRTGARPQRLGFEPQIQSVAYSEAGNRLAYSVRRRDLNVWLLALAGPGKADGLPRPVTTATSVDHQAESSPDGEKIAFWSNRTGNPEVWICDRDGSNPTRLTRLDGAGLSFPVWSPDGRLLMFGASVEESFDLFTIGVEGGKPRQVTDHPAIEYRGQWSPDMETIYFSSNRTGSNECYMMPADGGDDVQLTEGGGLNCRAPLDGEYLFYASSVNSSPLWRMPIGGGEATRIIPDLRHASAFAVSAEGVYFMPTPVDDAGASIHFMDFSSGNNRKVVDLPAQGAYSLSVTKDGKSLIWSQTDQAGADLMLVENFR